MWTMALFYPLRAMERLTGRAGEIFLGLRQRGFCRTLPKTGKL